MSAKVTAIWSHICLQSWKGQQNMTVLWRSVCLGPHVKISFFFTNHFDLAIVIFFLPRWTGKYFGHLCGNLSRRPEDHISIFQEVTKTKRALQKQKYQFASLVNPVALSSRTIWYSVFISTFLISKSVVRAITYNHLSFTLKSYGMTFK